MTNPGTPPAYGTSRHPRRGWRMAVALSLAGLALGGAVLVGTGRQPHPAAAEAGPAFREEHLQLAVFSEGAWWTVVIQLLVHDEGTGSYEAAAATARAEALARFPGAIEVTPGEAVAQYVINSYWWPAHTVAWNYNSSGKPASVANDQAMIQAAAATWGTAGAVWSFTGGSPTTAATGDCSQSGRDHQNTVGWLAKTGTTLAETCTWYPNGAPQPATASEFDMEIDPDWEWTTGTPVRIDLQSVVTHEFGHALGLGHPPSSQCPGATMCATYRSGTLTRTLQPDDIAGLIAIYGAAPASTPTPSPTPTVGPFHNIAPAVSKDR